MTFGFVFFYCSLLVFDLFGVCDLRNKSDFVFQLAAQLSQHVIEKFIATKLRCCSCTQLLFGCYVTIG